MLENAVGEVVARCGRYGERPPGGSGVQGRVIYPLHTGRGAALTQFPKNRSLAPDLPPRCTSSLHEMGFQVGPEGVVIYSSALLLSCVGPKKITTRSVHAERCNLLQFVLGDVALELSQVLCRSKKGIKS